MTGINSSSQVHGQPGYQFLWIDLQVILCYHNLPPPSLTIPVTFTHLILYLQLLSCSGSHLADWPRRQSKGVRWEVNRSEGNVWSVRETESDRVTLPARVVAADKLSISYKDYPVTLCCFQRSGSYGQPRPAPARLLNLLNGYQCSTFSWAQSLTVTGSGWGAGRGETQWEGGGEASWPFLLLSFSIFGRFLVKNYANVKASQAVMT